MNMPSTHRLNRNQLQSSLHHKNKKSHINDQRRDQMRFHRFLLISLLCMSVFSLALPLAIPLSLPLYAQTISPSFLTLGYQGDLFDASRTPLEGQFVLHFRLYSSLNGGEVMWQETHEEVSVHEGHFSVYLGSNVALPSELIQERDLFLGIQVGESEELSPRLQVGSALNAHWAEKSTSSLCMM